MVSRRVETRAARLASIVGLPSGGQGSCLVQIYGPNLGKKFDLAATEVDIGRDTGCEITVELDTVSRKHCTIAMRPDGFFLRDNASTNGTYVNGVEIGGDVPLKSGDLIKIGAAIFKFLSGNELGSIEAQYHEEIYRLTIIDGLTQLFNKRYLLDFIEREMARCARHKRSMSLIMLDIDHFKQLNDSRGHSAGDAVLREIGAVLKKRVRREECAARFGGEEFAIVLPETDLESAKFFADMLRKLIGSHEFFHAGDKLGATISAGVAALLPEHRTVEDFVATADARLYEAKRAGRDRVIAG